jgi:hypothetical protein
MDDYVIANCYQSIGFCQNPGSTARLARVTLEDLGVGHVPWMFLGGKNGPKSVNFPMKFCRIEKLVRGILK